MNLRVLENERYSCQSCSTCCRRWYAQLLGDEPRRVEALKWDEGDPLRGKKPTIEYAGKTYLARRSDGACLFLNEANGLCRIHEKFGVDAKPIGCRIFPFQFSRTFGSEVSVSVRYDCPTVRKNVGATHAEALPELRTYVNRVEHEIGQPFDELTRCYLSRDQLQAVSDYAIALLNGFPDDASRSLFLLFLSEWLSATQVDALDREALAQAYPALRKQVEAAMSGRLRRSGMMRRAAFRTVLGLFLRRDEDVLNHQATRLGRAFALLRFTLGFGGFQSLGRAHRRGKLRRAKLFHPNAWTQPATPSELTWRLIRNRLESFHFMGERNFGRNFIDGFRSLVLLSPLILAAAKYNAGNRGASELEPQDLDLATEAIEHSYGRLAILNEGLMHPLERLLLEPAAFARLVRSV